MDSHRFDAIVKQLYLLRSRRGVLQALATTGLAAFAATRGSEKVRARPKKDRRKRRNKRKIKKRCRLDWLNQDCSKVGESCVVNCSGEECCDAPSSCCDSGTGLVACQAHSKPECSAALPGDRCCLVEDVECVVDCQCCGDLTCADGACGRCSDLGEACAADEDCCIAEHVCSTVPKEGCPPDPEKRCCVDINGSCRSDCHCCGDSPCVDRRCGCRPDGEACRRDEDCCAPLTCQLGGICGSECPVPCPVGFFEPCCPPGTTCGQFGCVTEQPRACPAGANSCDHPLTFCAERRPLDCACYPLLLGGGVFCSAGISCGQECTTDAECETAPGNPIPGSRCVQCPTTCGHGPLSGVCAAPCPETA